ncbi:MAG: hypothetical protein R3B48_27040 [Kofleriaceae bacterium]
MILYQSRELAAEAADKLQAYQSRIDALPTYAERVKSAAEEFRRANTSTNEVFREIKRTLEEMTTPSARCMYCEDSLANEIEHYRPKGLYPESTFDWLNYLYACGSCNRNKGGRFALFAANTGEVTDVTRKINMPIEPPIVGDPLLLDPRFDDAARLLRLDLIDTFFFVPLPRPGDSDFLRAKYTIDTLKLNGRDALVAQRREYFHNYVARVEAYEGARERDASPAELESRKQQIQHMGHPTVWLEMRRQHGLHPRLEKLFARTPEALDWDSHACATKRA